MIDMIPESLKQKLLEKLIDFIVGQGEKFFDQGFGDKLRGLSAQGALHRDLDAALRRAIRRFEQEYIESDEDLVRDILAVPDFWLNDEVRRAILQIVARPRSWTEVERTVIDAHFATVLPQRRNRERVDKALAYLLRCVAEEVWNVPAAKEIREVYSLQTQRVSAEALQRQTALLEANFKANSQISLDLRDAVLQLIAAQTQHLLATPSAPAAPSRPRPWHNLPQPDYAHFVGRERELDWLKARLAPHDRAWQMLVVGIGGVGKSSLAQAIAHFYRERYAEASPAERFEVIVWISAKEQVLTVAGQEQAVPAGLMFRTLNDIYTALAQTLDREDITRAPPEEQDRLVQKALAEQRTLLIVDNFESVSDERVRSFLRHLPSPTKALITSREWLDLADVLRLTGLSREEAMALIASESEARAVHLAIGQPERLFERTAGLPLPIKLSVSRIAGGETFDAVLRWLGNADGNLPEYCAKSQVDLVRSRSEAGWLLLLASACFDRSAGASRDVLGQIADCSLADRDEGLALLLRFSLINRTDDDRFWLLPMVEGYVQAQSKQDQRGTAVVARWLDWSCHFAQGIISTVDFYDQQAAVAEREYPNLRVAVAWCSDHEEWKTLLTIAEGASRFADQFGRFNDFSDMLSRAADAAMVLGDRRAQGQIARRMARLTWLQGGALTDILTHLDCAETIAQEFGSQSELALIWLNRIDYLSDHTADLAALETLAERVLTIGAQLQSPSIKQRAAYRLSHLTAQQRRFEEAEQWLIRAAAWVAEEAPQREWAWLDYRRAVNLVMQGRTEEAEPMLERLREDAEAVGNWRLAGNCHYRLAQAYLSSGRYAQAGQSGQIACGLYARIGNQTRLTEVRHLLEQIASGEVLLHELLRPGRAGARPAGPAG